MIRLALRIEACGSVIVPHNRYGTCIQHEIVSWTYHVAAGRCSWRCCSAAQSHRSDRAKEVNTREALI